MPTQHILYAHHDIPFSLIVVVPDAVGDGVTESNSPVHLIAQKS
ncbi:MAG: hypothetical protein OEZ03_07760 [Alphaproteobacteria bacterium]|nr:hypothetical protein [Alphaproteobacteria bacterium]